MSSLLTKPIVQHHRSRVSPIQLRDFPLAVAISASVGSIPRALATGCCGSLFGMSGSSMSDLAFSSERKNRNHLSRPRPLSRSSLPSSSLTHGDSTYFISSSCTDLMFWKNPCWSPTRSCFSNSTTWRSKKRTTAALRTLFSQLHAFLTALRSSFASLVSIFRRCHAACIASVAACSSASVRASPLRSRPCLLLSWDGITNSAVRMMAVQCFERHEQFRRSVFFSGATYRNNLISVGGHRKNKDLQKIWTIFFFCSHSALPTK